MSMKAEALRAWAGRFLGGVNYYSRLEGPPAPAALSNNFDKGLWCPKGPGASANTLHFTEGYLSR